jgi:hypothetical protein
MKARYECFSHDLFSLSRNPNKKSNAFTVEPSIQCTKCNIVFLIKGSDSIIESTRAYKDKTELLCFITVTVKTEGPFLHLLSLKFPKEPDFEPNFEGILERWKPASCPHTLQKFQRSLHWNQQRPPLLYKRVAPHRGLQQYRDPYRS